MQGIWDACNRLFLRRRMDWAVEERGSRSRHEYAQRGFGSQECGLLLAELHFLIDAGFFGFLHLLETLERRDCRVISYSSGLGLGRSTPWRSESDAGRSKLLL